MKITSTVALGDGALGSVSLFTIPQGHRMHFLGNIPFEKVPVLDEATTSIKVAGSPGALPITDYKVKSVQVRTSTGAKVAGGFEIFSGVTVDDDGKTVAKSVAKGALLEVYDAAQPLNFTIRRTDVFEVRVTLPNEPALKLPPKSPPLLLTLELEVDPA